MQWSGFSSFLMWSCLFPGGRGEAEETEEERVGGIRSEGGGPYVSALPCWSATAGPEKQPRYRDNPSQQGASHINFHHFLLRLSIRTLLPFIDTIRQCVDPSGSPVNARLSVSMATLNVHQCPLLVHCR